MDETVPHRVPLGRSGPLLDEWESMKACRLTIPCSFFLGHDFSRAAKRLQKEVGLHPAAFRAARDLHFDLFRISHATVL